MSSFAIIWRGDFCRRAQRAVSTAVVGALLAGSASGAISVLHNFQGGLSGEGPTGTPLVDSDDLYGVTTAGGNGGLSEGVLWKRNVDTGAYVVLHNFEDAVDGSGSIGDLTIVGRELYGTNTSGGMFEAGTLWSYQLDTQAFTVKKHFDAVADGAFPRGLTAVGNELVGICEQGGSDGSGALWKYNVATQSFTTLHDFEDAVDGGLPFGQLVARSNIVYGAALTEGAEMGGTLWSFQLASQTFTKLHDFGAIGDGASPTGGVVVAGDLVLGATQNQGANDWGTIWAYNTANQTLTTRHDFTEGQAPRGRIAVLGPVMYGIADGGAHEAGVLWAFDYTTNQYSVLADFELESSGGFPTGVELIGGQLLGVSNQGGANSAGTLWKFPLAQRLGDFNGDGAVDAADYTTWRDRQTTAAILNGDPTPGNVSLDDLAIWSGSFESNQPALAIAIPEPSALVQLLIALCMPAVVGGVGKNG